MDELTLRLRTVSEFWLLREVLNKINGFLTDIEGFTLYSLARFGDGEGVIVEIGSFEGKSTGWLVLGSRQANREMVYAVDTFAGSPEHQDGALMESASIKSEGTTFHAFQRNMNMIGMSDHVSPIVAASVDAAAAWDGGPIRLLFIDGEHTYEACSADYHAWIGHMAPGGFVAFHDYTHSPDVRRFCDELKADGSGVEYRYTMESVCVFQLGRN